MTLGGSFSQQFAGGMYADEINIHVDADDEDGVDDVADMSFAQLQSGRDIELRVRRRAMWRSQLPGLATTGIALCLWGVISRQIIATPSFESTAPLAILGSGLGTVLAVWMALPESFRSLRMRQRAVQREAEDKLVEYDTEIARRACARDRLRYL